MRRAADVLGLRVLSINPRGLRPGFSETFPFPLRFTDGERKRRLAFFDSGPPASEATGPPILLVHGLGGNFSHWEHVARELARDHRVFGLDLPGCGDSVKLPVSRDLRYTIRLYADAAVHLLDHLRVDAAVFVGHSLGGMVVTQASLAHPSRMLRQVLIDAAGFRRYGAHLKLASRLLVPGLVGPAMERLAHTLLRNVFHASNPHVDKFINQTKGRPAHPTIDDFAEMACSILPDLVGKHFLDELERILHPTLVIWGDRDKLLPYAEVPGWVRRLPDGRLLTLAGCGHMPIIERPTEVVEAVRAFASEEGAAALRQVGSA